FIQSQVSAHAELANILNNITKLAELQRMTQFKDKITKHPQNINLGLFSYPVLMTADILLYQTNLVPVGDDQKQHLELTRTLAQRFNKLFGKTFIIPDALINKQGCRIMSLTDPNKKMDKSEANAYSYISLLDPPSVIRKKIQKAETDSGKEIVARPDKPAISNLLNVYTSTSDAIGVICTIGSDTPKFDGYGEFKKDLAEKIIKLLKPIQKKYQELDKKPDK
ncbi:unnamed protein product, partial [marine sediment metagenome]